MLSVPVSRDLMYVDVTPAANGTNGAKSLMKTLDTLHPADGEVLTEVETKICNC